MSLCHNDEIFANLRPRQARPSRIFAKPQRHTDFREGRACPVRNRECFAITSVAILRRLPYIRRGSQVRGRRQSRRLAL